MKRLTPTEDRALILLLERGSICPGTDGSPEAIHEVRRILDGLVKAKRVVVENTDDGPSYSLTRRGRWEAEAIARERADA